MKTLTQSDRHSLSLLTNLYELTMAHVSWKGGIAHHEAVSHLIYRASLPDALASLSRRAGGTGDGSGVPKAWIAACNDPTREGRL